MSASLKDKVLFDAEYLGATDPFEAGELSFDGGKARKPKACNVESAYGIAKNLELAVRYEGSDDCGDLLPEKQYGGAITYVLLEHTSLAFECLHGKFENDDKRALLTGQIAVEF